MMSKLFSFPIYVQGLKHLRALGSCAAAFLVLINLIVTSYVDFDSLWWGDKCKYCVKGLSHYKIFVTDWSIVLVVIVPLITYYMFSYLHNRNGADFYHSLPTKRGAMFISQWAATLTWLFGAVAMFVATNAIYWIAEGGPLHFSVWFNTLACTCVLVLYLSASTVLGITLTGNALSATAAVVAIGWLPYFIMSFFEESLKHLFPRIIPEMTALKYIGSDQFLPKRLYMDDYGGNYSVDGGLIISAAFALVLGAIAYIIYVKRQSETATTAAVSNGAQHFIRGAVALPVVLMAAEAVVNKSGGFALGRWIFAALVIYLLYELIATYSVKRVIKAVPWFLTVLLVGASVLGSLYLTVAVMRSGDPTDPTKIESVVLYGNCYVEGKYLFTRDTGITVDGEDMIKKLTESYEEPVSNYRIKINYKNGKTVHRRIYVSNENVEKLIDYIMVTYDKKNKSILPLPEWERLDTEYRSPKFDREFWDTFVEEYYKLNLKDRRIVANKEDHQGVHQVFSVGCSYDVGWGWEVYQVDPKRTPKTYKRLMELRKEQGIVG